MKLASNVTAVCASALPCNLAPVLNTIAVLDKIFPLKSAVVPSVAFPATCQKMFLGSAPPLRIIFFPDQTVKFPAIWNISHLSDFEPNDFFTHLLKMVIWRLPGL